MFKTKRKPIDAAFIDFILRKTPDVDMRYNQPQYADFKQMSTKELCAIYWQTLEILEDMKPWDPAHARFDSTAVQIRQFIHYRYLSETMEYREENLAIYIPSNITGVRASDLKDLNDALAIYGNNTFSYTYTDRALIIIPLPGKSRSPELLEFLEVLQQFKLGEGASATDSSFWKPQ